MKISRTFGDTEWVPRKRVRGDAKLAVKSVACGPKFATAKNSLWLAVINLPGGNCLERFQVRFSGDVRRAQPRSEVLETLHNGYVRLALDGISLHVY